VLVLELPGSSKICFPLLGKLPILRRMHMRNYLSWNLLAAVGITTKTRLHTFRKWTRPLLYFVLVHLYRTEITYMRSCWIESTLLLLAGWNYHILFPQNSRYPLILVSNCFLVVIWPYTYTGICKSKGRGVRHDMRQITPEFPSQSQGACEIEILGHEQY